MFHTETMDIRADGENVKSISISKSLLPFYELPQRKTSAEIINEARVAILGEFVLFFSIVIFQQNCKYLLNCASVLPLVFQYKRNVLRFA